MSEHVQFEANVDDMDPRLWPNVIDKLIEAGADDAWVTPILMKKGRPAFTVGALCEQAVAERVRAVFFTETTTIGLRELPAHKHVLDREQSTVTVDGCEIGVKIAFLNGAVINRSVEWDDVATAAERLGRPAKEILAEATAEATAAANGQTKQT